MFILPLMAILLGVEFYLVFERTTDTYERNLTEGYTMLVVSKKPVKLDTFQKLNQHIITSTQIERTNIVSEVAKGISKSNSEAILKHCHTFIILALTRICIQKNWHKLKKILSQIKILKR